MNTRALLYVIALVGFVLLYSASSKADLMSDAKPELVTYYADAFQNVKDANGTTTAVGQLINTTSQLFVCQSVTATRVATDENAYPDGRLYFNHRLAAFVALVQTTDQTGEEALHTLDVLMHAGDDDMAVFLADTSDNEMASIDEMCVALKTWVTDVAASL